jgi:hypothetical protein
MGSSLDKLLATVDVVCRASECCVAHDVNGQCCDVGRSYDASDRQRGAEFGAPLIEIVAEERCREARVDEARCDQVDADRGVFEREVGNQGDNATVAAETIPRPALGRRASVPPINTSEPEGLTLSAAARVTSIASNRCSVRPRRASSGGILRGGP